MTNVAVVFIALSLFFGGFCPVNAENIPNSANSSITSTDGPAVVLATVFELLKNGKTDEAAAFFTAKTPVQEKAVFQYVTRGAAFFSANPQVKSRVVQTFTNGDLALCAIEQSSTEMPDKWELEKSFLVKDSGRWLLLPIQQNYRSYKNELSSEDVSLFESLVNDFSVFRRNLP